MVSRFDTPPTVIHRLHPLVKMGAGAGLTALALVLTRPEALGLILCVFLLALTAARLRPTLRQILGLLILVGMVGGLNYWAARDPAQAVSYSLRLAVFGAGMPVMAAATRPQELARALSQLPVPAGVTLALLLVWRFFPEMASEAREMRRAARLRGRQGGGGMHRLVRGYLVPMAFCMVEYADRISLALELRGFSPSAGRTCFRPPRLHRRDALFGMLILGAGFAAGWLQWGAGAV